DTLELERRLLDVRHEEDRPAGIEQGSFGDHFLDGVAVRLRLTDHREIEPPRQAAELLAGPGHAAAERQRLCRYAGARCGTGKVVRGGLGGEGIVMLLGVDHVGGDIARAGERNDRIVQEGNAGDVRLEGRSDRDSVFAGEAPALTQAEIDEDVFDHESLLGAGPHRTNADVERAPPASERNQMPAGRSTLLLDFALSIKLLDVGPQVLGLLLVLDAGKDHFGVRDLYPGILDVILEALLVPGDAGILVGVGIAEIRDAAGLAAVESV